jgi:hypothetical protein
VEGTNIRDISTVGSDVARAIGSIAGKVQDLAVAQLLEQKKVRDNTLYNSLTEKYTRAMAQAEIEQAKIPDPDGRNYVAGMDEREEEVFKSIQENIPKGSEYVLQDWDNNYRANYRTRSGPRWIGFASEKAVNHAMSENLRAANVIKNWVAKEITDKSTMAAAQTEFYSIFSRGPLAPEDNLKMFRTEASNAAKDWSDVLIMSNPAEAVKKLEDQNQEWLDIKLEGVPPKSFILKEEVRLSQLERAKSHSQSVNENNFQMLKLSVEQSANQMADGGKGVPGVENYENTKRTAIAQGVKEPVATSLAIISETGRQTGLYVTDFFNAKTGNEALSMFSRPINTEGMDPIQAKIKTDAHQAASRKFYTDFENASKEPMDFMLLRNKKIGFIGPTSASELYREQIAYGLQPKILSSSAREGFLSSEGFNYEKKSPAGMDVVAHDGEMWNQLLDYSGNYSREAVEELLATNRLNPTVRLGPLVIETLSPELNELHASGRRLGMGKIEALSKLFGESTSGMTRKAEKELMIALTAKFGGEFQSERVSPSLVSPMFALIDKNKAKYQDDFAGAAEYVVNLYMQKKTTSLTGFNGSSRIVIDKDLTSYPKNAGLSISQFPSLFFKDMPEIMAPSNYSDGLVKKFAEKNQSPDLDFIDLGSPQGKSALTPEGASVGIFWANAHNYEFLNATKMSQKQLRREYYFNGAWKVSPEQHGIMLVDRGGNAVFDATEERRMFLIPFEKGREVDKKYNVLPISMKEILDVNKDEDLKKDAEIAKQQASFGAKVAKVGWTISDILFTGTSGPIPSGKR